MRQNKLLPLHSLLLAYLFFFCCCASCSRDSSTDTTARDAPASRQPAESLMLFNWQNYIGSKTLAGFEKSTGIHVTEVTFSVEEEMLGEVQTNLSAYDVVVASDDTVREMIEAKLLARIDTSKLKHFSNIAPKYRNPPCDPQQQYTVPYLMGSTGMLVNKKYIKDNVDSWQILWDSRYAGKIAMLDDPFDVIAVACQLLGYSINTVKPDELLQARQLLLRQRPLLRGYLDVTTIQTLMIDEELWAAHVYSGEGLAAAAKNKQLAYSIPREGAAVWTDYFIIPRDARHKQEALRFLDYILEPPVMAAIASELWYATPNTAAQDLISPEVLRSPSVYPPSEVMARCEVIRKEAESVRIVQTLWSKLMAEK